MGGIIGGIFGGSGNTEAERGQLESLRNAAMAFQQYRPEAMQARLNALSNISTAYQPANNLLETMYGGSGQNQGFMAGMAPNLGKGNKI